MKILVVLSVAVAVGVGGAFVYAQTTAPRTKVFVFTAAAKSDGDKNWQSREDSVKDLKAAIAGRKNSLELVDDRERADLTLELLERRTVPSKRLPLNRRVPVYGKDGKVTSYRYEPGLPQSDDQLRAMVRAGASQTELVSEVGSTGIRTWRYAAGIIVKDLEKWVSANRAALRTPPRRP